MLDHPNKDYRYNRFCIIQFLKRTEKNNEQYFYKISFDRRNDFYLDGLGVDRGKENRR